MSSWDEAVVGAYLPADTVLGQIEAAVVVTDRLSNLLYANAYAAKLFDFPDAPERLVAWRPTMTIPSIAPEGWRSGTAWARMNTRDPPDRTEANVPSQARPRSTCLASSAALPLSSSSKPRESRDRPTRRSGASGKSNSLAA